MFTPGLYTRGQRNLVGKSGYQGIGLTVLWLSVVSCSCLHQGSIHVLESDVRSMHLSQACSWSNESKLQFPFSLFMSQSLRDLIYTNATLRSPKQNKRFQFIYFQVQITETELGAENYTITSTDNNLSPRKKTKHY